ncbi:MAG TPA: SAM-dependent chlorinase/fluorinase [Actinomycetota bacterium]|nr:SAM-dependent chlorinase/fluorinase [Actinomycetota bacterium]
MIRPIVFLTDYGLEDEFVGICHAVIAGVAPGARVIDLTHGIPRQDVRRGALVLARALPYLPPDPVLLAVVDPGVGSGRRSVAVETASGLLLVGPDNGLLSPASEAAGGPTRAVEIVAPDVVRQPPSRTFHGRDVFAPAAAHLAMGRPLEALGPAVDPATLVPLELPRARVERGRVGCEVTGVDRFGNVQLSATPADLSAAGLRGAFRLGRRRVRLVGTFADAPPGELAAVEDSQGYVALVVNGGSAAAVTELRDGDEVVLS